MRKFVSLMGKYAQDRKQFNMNNKKGSVSRPTFIDLFAGSGGLSLGLEQAGFQSIFFNEIEPVFASTYMANRKIKKGHYYVGDINKLNEELSKFREAMRHELGILTGEALTSAVKGKKFSVMIPSSQITADSLDVKECKCGPSYLDFGKWSECSSAGTDKGSLILEFTGGEWRNDSVPCFMDLYMIIREKSGRKYAGVVRMRVRD